MAGVKGFAREVDKVNLLTNWCAILRSYLGIAEEEDDLLEGSQLG